MDLLKKINKESYLTIISFIFFCLMVFSIEYYMHINNNAVNILIIILFFVISLINMLLILTTFFDKIDNSIWLLIAVFINSFFTLMLQDYTRISFDLIIIDLTLIIIYVSLIFLSLSKDELFNIERMILLIFFTGCAPLFSSDFKTTILLLGTILFTNTVTTVITSNFEEKSANYIPVISKYKWINKIFVYRYYYAVSFFYFNKKITSSIEGKIIYVIYWFSFHAFISYKLGNPGLSLVISQIYANILISSAVSYYSLIRFPKIRKYTESNLDQIKREYFTEKINKLFTKGTLQLLAFSGVFSIPWATYTWSKEQTEQSKKWAVEQLSQLSEDLKKSAPEWVKELEYMSVTGQSSSNYIENAKKFHEALRKSTGDDSGDKKLIEGLYDQMKSKDDQIKSKDDQIKSKDDQIKSKDDQIKKLLQIITDNKNDNLRQNSSLNEEVKRLATEDVNKFLGEG